MTTATLEAELREYAWQVLNNDTKDSCVSLFVALATQCAAVGAGANWANYTEARKHSIRRAGLKMARNIVRQWAAP